MYTLRKWAVTHARFFNATYKRLENILVALDPVCKTIGYQRLEKPITFVEKNIKGLLFDCQMCGHCVLHETGMSCPMNCPKELRNGPCGGVRPNGHCEVKPEMRCVWVEAWRGNQKLNPDLSAAESRESILRIQAPVDNRLRGHSSWLKEVRKRTQQQPTNNTHDV